MIRRITERASGFAKNIPILKSSRFHGESLDSSVSPVLIPGVHVFHCQDAVGIVAKLSDCIAAKGGNILGYDVFVPENNNVFYSRRSPFLLQNLPFFSNFLVQ